MPDIISEWPVEAAAIIRHARYEQYMDGRVYVFDSDDFAFHGIKEDSTIIVGGRHHNALQQLRNHITQAVRYYHGSYMYKAKIMDDKLYFVFGEMTCRVGHCTIQSVTNTPHCEEHQDYNYYEEREKQTSSRRFHPAQGIPYDASKLIPDRKDTT